MVIKEIIIKNYKSFEDFSLSFNNDLNIIVGDNEVGKSSLLEAINLALTRQLNGRNIDYEISSFLFNKSTTDQYLTEIQAGNKPELPKIIIELYFEDHDDLIQLKGSINTKRTDAIGIQLRIDFDDNYSTEYTSYIADKSKVTTIPTEYYKVSWLSFAGNTITKRSLPINTVFIDPTTIQLFNGTDYYIQKIINNHLELKEKAELSLAYRQLKESFSKEDSIEKINDKLNEDGSLIEGKSLKVSIDITKRNGWETNLTSYLDDVPFHNLGKGEQNVLKILLALDRSVHQSNVILIEEPENHLSFTKMSRLIDTIKERCANKQLLITTHSTFVMNKLGIEKVILLSEGGNSMTLESLEDDTQKYFKRLPGYDTLRLLIAKKSFLVEGPSDELIVQKAYIKKYGKLPIEDEIDVITVRGLSFKRFLEIAVLLKKEVYVFTDNDGDYGRKVVSKYADYSGKSFIHICFDPDNNYPTLEPQLVKYNKLTVLNNILGKTYTDPSELIDYMTKSTNKTDCAMKIFDTDEDIIIPPYIYDNI